MSEMTSEFKNILSQKDLLNSLASAKKNMRKAIIQNADKKLICAVCESINNALAGNVSINSSDMDHLKKYKHTFRRLIKKSPLREKKKILIQNGGFLQFLIPAVVTGIASIVSSLISKHTSEPTVEPALEK
jgi:predicted ATP-binding protein involved in virulence